MRVSRLPHPGFETLSVAVVIWIALVLAFAASSRVRWTWFSDGRTP
jgi:hypothetical protein